MLVGIKSLQFGSEHRNFISLEMHLPQGKSMGENGQILVIWGPKRGVFRHSVTILDTGIESDSGFVGLYFVETVLLRKSGKWVWLQLQLLQFKFEGYI